MVISVKHLAKGESLPIKFNSVVKLPEMNLINSNVNVDINGLLTNNGDQYILSAKVKCELLFNCYSCLKDESIQLNFNIDEIYTKIDSDDEEVFTFSSSENIIDFTEAVKNAILLNIPMKMICSTQCKGLCYICGQNLNQNNCSCQKDYINPKFEKFLKMFNNKEV